MSNTKIVVLIVVGVLVVCLIGAGIVLGLYFTQHGDNKDFFGMFRGSRVTADETHALNLDGVTSLNVECSAGTVTVLPGDKAEVSMTGTLWTPDQRDEYLSVSETNGKLSVVFDLDTALFSWSDIDITVTLPKDCGLDLRLACASANTNLEDMTLGNVSVSCASGRAAISGCTGGTLDINTASGGIKLEDSAFSTVMIGCQSGDIDIRGTQGDTTVRCTSGTVKVTDVTGALDINNTSGSVTVDLAQKEIDPISIDVTSGSLTLYLNADAEFDLDADTTSGGISCDFDRTVTGGSSGSIVGDHISGTVNGGGVSVSLRTVSGGINIKKH